MKKHSPRRGRANGRCLILNKGVGVAGWHGKCYKGGEDSSK